MIGDPTLAIAKLYDMLPADAEKPRKAARRQQRYGSHVFVIGPDKKDQDDARLSDEHRPELRRDPARDRFAANHCQDGRVDAVNWKPGEDVVIPAAMPEDEAKAKFPAAGKR
jgi:alkyl hydroperoxide reductase subunit AhpC